MTRACLILSICFGLFACKHAEVAGEATDAPGATIAAPEIQPPPAATASTVRAPSAPAGTVVITDGQGKVVKVDGKVVTMERSGPDGKSSVVTSPSGTKATASDGRSVQINKDGSIVVPGRGKIQAP